MSKLRVYYGWARLNKIRKREAISVVFENCQQNGKHAEKFLKRIQDTVYVRFQTDEEATDAEDVNRMYTEFSIFLDHKSIKGSLKLALLENHNADSTHVPEKVRDEIRDKLNKAFLTAHPNYKEPSEKVSPINNQTKSQ